VVEDHDQRAARLASAHGRHIQTTEDGRVLSERVGEGVGGRQRVADGRDALPESPIAGLSAERGEDPDQMEAGLQHGGKLAGEEHQRAQADTPTEAPERPLEHLAKGGGAGSIGSTEGDNELSAVSELLEQLRRVLRLLSASADDAGGIHDLVLEDRHRYSWSATTANTSSSVVTPCATLRSPDNRNGTIRFLTANSRMWSAERPERIMPRTSAVMRKTSNNATRPANPVFRHRLHPRPRWRTSGQPTSASTTRSSGPGSYGSLQCVQIFLINRCAAVRFTADATRKGSTPMLTRRTIVATASLACTVEKTRCPVSAARAVRSCGSCPMAAGWCRGTG